MMPSHVDGPAQPLGASERVALIHEWLDTFGGSERVLEQIANSYPMAEVFALVDFMDATTRRFLDDHVVHTSFLQGLPWAERHFRRYLPLMPLAIEQFDLSEYDVVISSSHAVAKGVITGPHQTHVSYVHSPMRYAWDLQHQYLREAHLERGLRSAAARAILHYLRTWDVRTANGVDSFIANSHFIARRIWKTYRRRAEVVYPPVDVERFVPGDSREDYYLTTSRLVPYKRVDIIVDAFGAMPDRKLIVVGDGPELNSIRRRAGRNVELLGHQPAEIVLDLTQKARAFVFAAIEDFGIAPVEAQAAGIPVIAFGRGGVRESVVGPDRPDPTGVFFEYQTPAAVHDAVRHFEAREHQFDPDIIRKNALRFSPAEFRARFADCVRRARTEHLR